jgi:hypothetical protein
MIKKIEICLGLCSAMLVGLVVGLYAQSNSAARLAKLSEDKAEISKMDWVLLNTRISVLQQMLKDDLSLPFAPTSFSYDADKKKIRISVNVDSAVLAKMGANQLTKTLESRATSLCVAPELADGNFSYMLSIQPPKEYCAIRFFTLVVDSSGHVEPKDVATFEDGKLNMR